MPVPLGTQLDDVAVTLVGTQNVEVTVGARQLSVRLPAPGDPAACTARLRPRNAPTELRITVAPLVSAIDPQPHRATASDTAQERRRAGRVREIEERRAVLATEIADAERDGQAAAASKKAAAEAGTKRRDQIARLEQMVRMQPAQLEEMAANVGVGGADAFVAKLHTQMDPIRRCISQHEEEETAARTKQARASSRAAALRAEDGSLRTELEQLRSQRILPAAELSATTDSNLAAYSLSRAEFVDCSAFADASVPFRCDGSQGTAADRTAVALGDHGWAVCDNFVGEELVRAVRREIAGPRLSKSYEDSEIWVGKEAGVGAQLSVPSVRGDRVLWLRDDDVDAGGHSAIASLTARIDSFIFELMSPRLSSLAGLSERTDAMFAIYPVRQQDRPSEGSILPSALCLPLF